MKIVSRLQELVVILFLIIYLPVHAQAQEKEYPIDKALKACLDKNYSTMGTVQCLDQAYISWDKELNQIYKLLGKQLKPAYKNIMKQAQLDWLKYRNSEFQLINMVYSQLQGTMYIPVAVDRKIEIVKMRTLELSNYLDMLKQ
jgi:uncharacterized protein YecT (DUF1311 family)